MEIYFSNNTNIESLPKDLEVKGDLDLRYTEIKSLPENLNVGGNIEL